MRERYKPIENIMSSPRVRTLKALRRHGWVTSEEFQDAAGARERNARVMFWRQLKKLAAEGHVERSGDALPRYRITTSGIAELERLLEPAALNESRA